MTTQQPQGDLARCVNHNPDDSWPTMIEIVAYWGKDGRKGRRRSVEIPADQFFGRGAFGAPMSGEQLVGMVDKLRRQGPDASKR
jgi:hypothetical protein